MAANIGVNPFADPVRQCHIRIFMPFLQLPSLVFHMIVEYLSPREKAVLSRVSRIIRDKLNSNLKTWKDVDFVISPQRLNQCCYIVKFLQERNATSLSFLNISSEQIQETILKGFPNLISLSIPISSSSTPRLIEKYCKNLKTLHIWKLHREFYRESSLNLGIVFRRLVHLECLHLEGGSISSKLYPECTNDIKRGIVCHPSITKLELNFGSMEISWLVEVCCSNPRLKSLRVDQRSDMIRNILLEIDKYREKVLVSTQWFEDVPLEEVNFQGLQLLRNRISPFGNFDKWQSLVSLDLSYCRHEVHLTGILDDLYKLPKLIYLNLTMCAITNYKFLGNLPKLHHLELRSSGIKFIGIQRIASAMSSSLKYLGLANCYHIQSADIKQLPLLFDSLDTVDLSGCDSLDFDVLKEWYLRPIKPKLCPRKIIAKGCEHVDSEMFKNVREKFRNKLLILT